jgi:predicted nucleotidyltransferase
MGDIEVTYLIEYGILPDTQPYRAIIEGENTRVQIQQNIVEFCAPTELG